MPDPAGPWGAGDRFPPTRRSVVLAARDADPEVRRRAWEALAASYWKPVYKLLRARWRLDREDAEDLTQEFFAAALARGISSATIPPKPASAPICAPAWTASLPTSARPPGA